MDERTRRILEYVLRERDRLVEEVRRLLRMPSISATGEGVEEVASYLAEWVKERLGGTATLLRYGGHPIMYGRVGGSTGRKIVFYNMYDVQPPEPLDEWEAPPFEARIVGDRIIARGAYNTKAGLMSMLLGLEAYMNLYGDPPLDVYIVFEGEEELGSPSLPKFIEDKGEELKGAEMVYFAFPTERIPGKPAIVLGNKGIVFMEIRCKTSKYDVHSSFSRGLYNPAAILARIVSHLIDPLEAGHVLHPALGEDQPDLRLCSPISVPAAEDEFIHRAGPQHTWALLPQHPPYGIHNIGLSTAIGADDGTDPRRETDLGSVGKGLETLDDQAMKPHGAVPLPWRL